jgi:hypothetical protein
MIPLILAAAADAHTPTNWGVIVAIASFAINTLAVVIGATLGVSKLRESSALISQSVGHLKEAVTKLDSSVVEIFGHTRDHGERIARLEAQSK